MFHRLLIAIDDSAESQVVLDFATALARRSRASLHVVHVNQYVVGGRGVTELSETEASRLVEGAVRQLREELRGEDLKVTGSAVRATCFNLSRAIVDVAEQKHSEAIVLGSRRRRRLGRIFGHGMRERITSLSPLPVLVAPAPLEMPRFGGRGRHHVPALAGHGQGSVRA